jgi:hypothetical protein
MNQKEKDPNNIDQHDPGAKLDQGKLLAGILQQFSLALTAVLEVATFGANKYSRGGWKHVKNGQERYSDAMIRHYLKEALEPLDLDSGLLHEAHLAWNALARLELKLQEIGQKATLFDSSCTFSHKCALIGMGCYSGGKHYFTTKAEADIRAEQVTNEK